MLAEFLLFGAGAKRKGKGEHALAILSKRIAVTGVGDIIIDGTNAIELKVATTSGSGRLGEGGRSTEHVLQILNQFPELKPIISDRKTKGLNIENFVKEINAIQPELTSERRDAIGRAVFEDRFGNQARHLINAFAKPNADPAVVRNKYIQANFMWYKGNAMGGKWQTLVSMVFGSKNTFIVARTSTELINLYKNGSLLKDTPYVIPTSATDIFYQVNPT